MPMYELMNLECVHCGGLIMASHSSAGKMVKCPSCRRENMVPMAIAPPTPQPVSEVTEHRAKDETSTSRHLAAIAEELKIQTGLLDRMETAVIIMAVIMIGWVLVSLWIAATTS